MLYAQINSKLISFPYAQYALKLCLKENNTAQKQNK